MDSNHRQEAYLSQELSFTLCPFVPYTLLLHFLSAMQSLEESTRSLSTFFRFFRVFNSVVGPSGLEPPTSCLSGTRSNLLSYDPMWCFPLVKMMVIPKDASKACLLTNLLRKFWTWCLRIKHHPIIKPHKTARDLFGFMVEMMGFDSRANCALGHSRLWQSFRLSFSTAPTSNPALFSSN